MLVATGAGKTLEHVQHTEALRQMTELGFRPVFIMGHHRSGTTILYKVLAETGLFNVTTAYHVLNSHRLQQIRLSGGEQAARAELQRLFESRGLKDREFDSMAITPEIPEEYAWALDHQGLRPGLEPKNLESFIRFCRDVNAMQEPDRPLLLKNPFDTGRFQYIERTFPSAQFVHIHRNPVDVVNSQLKAIRSILVQKNEYVALVMRRYRRLYEHPAKLAVARFVYSDRWPLLVTQVARNIARTNDLCVDHGGVISDRRIDVTYPQLCAAPNETIGGIVGFLGLDDRSGRDYAQYINPREPTLLDEVRARRERIRARNLRYCEMFGI